ncbi:hypothetical protein F5884DRAFT_752708 [Xylogone sp. PMI_703]|nr:hypothetical protein F5884DRAFT_752708 [Xylogone sp. PMI_703]
MWKKLKNSGARHASAADPGLAPNPYGDLPYDGSKGMGIPVNRGAPPPRPPRTESMGGDLPLFPPNRNAYAQQPTYLSQGASSHHRGPSSLYSQPSPNPVVTNFDYQNSYASPDTYDTAEVSPPSSPDFSRRIAHGNNYQYDDDVSPIDEDPDASIFTSKRPTNIPKPLSSGIPVLVGGVPILRREKTRNKTPSEPSTIARKQVSSGGFNPAAADEENATVENGPTTTRSKPSFAERARKIKEQNKQMTQPRPEWRGASGRATIASPVEDDITVAPLNIPRKSSKRVSSRPDLRARTSETPTASPVVSKHIDPAIRTIESSDRETTPTDLASSNAYRSASFSTSQPYPSPPPEKLNATTKSRHRKQDSVDSIERQFRDTFRNVSFPGTFPADPKDTYAEPASRFSVTTYAPSTAQTSPRPSLDASDRPPMPTPPQAYTTSEQQNSILNRRRPKVEESPKATQRKAINASPIKISMSSSVNVNTPRRVSDVSKSLPKSPAEALASTQDLIASLEAQLENLAVRRGNVTKSIRQMTQLMPTDSLTAPPAVLAKREEEKKKVEMLKEEEADIKRQEHEIGLRLHRAWKRRDNDAVYEPTGLWVRRINS